MKTHWSKEKLFTFGLILIPSIPMLSWFIHLILKGSWWVAILCSFFAMILAAAVGLYSETYRVLAPSKKAILFCVLSAIFAQRVYYPYEGDSQGVLKIVEILLQIVVCWVTIITVSVVIAVVAEILMNGISQKDMDIEPSMKGVVTLNVAFLLYLLCLHMGILIK